MASLFREKSDASADPLSAPEKVHRVKRTMAEPDFDSSVETQLSIHEAITSSYKLVASRKRQFADYAPTSWCRQNPRWAIQGRM